MLTRQFKLLYWGNWFNLKYCSVRFNNWWLYCGKRCENTSFSLVEQWIIKQRQWIIKFKNYLVLDKPINLHENTNEDELIEDDRLVRDRNDDFERNGESNTE